MRRKDEGDYEEIGLLTPARRVSGRREYGTQAVNDVRLIQAAQQAGFTLEEIRTLQSALGDSTSRRWPKLARAKLDELDASTAALQRARAALTSALDCACAGVADECRLVAPRRSGAGTARNR